MDNEGTKANNTKSPPSIVKQPESSAGDETPKRQNPFDKEEAKSEIEMEMKEEDAGEDKVDSADPVPEQQQVAEKPSEGDPSKPCAIYFGVKSYLHHFYEVVSVKNPNLYEECSQTEDYHYLIRPRKRKCSSAWFKVGLVVGANLLIWGVVAILVGYVVPRRQVVVGYDHDLEIIDRTALKFNTDLELCKLAGLILFCVGGMVTVVTLLFPTFLYSYCDDSVTVEPFRVSIKEEFVPRSPTDKKIPVTEQIKTVQPVWEKSSLATKKGLVSFP